MSSTPKDLFETLNMAAVSLVWMTNMAAKFARMTLFLFTDFSLLSLTPERIKGPTI